MHVIETKTSLKCACIAHWKMFAEDIHQVAKQFIDQQFRHHIVTALQLQL